jgi:hypothetical protein
MAAAAGDFEALGAMLLAAEAAAGAAEAFTRAGDPRAATVTHTRALGARHTGYGVRATHYQTLGDALLAALAAILGDTFDAPTRQAWTLAYNLVAETMLEGAAAARPGPSAADRRPETGQRKRLILADVLDQPERALHPPVAIAATTNATANANATMQAALFRRDCRRYCAA